jgi:hypothetical protein
LSYLCIEGEVDGVISTDSDNLVYGCPVWIYSIKEEIVEYVCISDVIAALGIPFLLFQDLCIMSECDFNTGLRGIGCKKLFPALKYLYDTTREHAMTFFIALADMTIREIPDYRILVSKAPTELFACWTAIKNQGHDGLRITRCREIFTFRATKEFTKMGRRDPQSPDADIRSLLRVFQIEYLIEELLNLRAQLPLVTSQPQLRWPYTLACTVA